ncbi:MAG: MBL fold metallo-hydrolase [Chloroflexota bacterium]
MKLSSVTLHCIVNDDAPQDAGLQAEHGVAFLIETPTQKLLFDTGQSGEALLQNAQAMGLHLDQVDALALSHAHYDHTGGLKALMGQVRPDLPLYANTDLFRPRFARRSRERRSIGLEVPQQTLAEKFTLYLSAAPVAIFPGVWTSGEITGRTRFEGRSAHHGILVDGHWQPDPYRDDLSLVIEHAGGLILVCGCCHAGLLNTLAHVRRMFPGEHVLAIVGGAHLGNATPEMLEETVAALRSLNSPAVPRLYLNHCTGQAALQALAQAFGERVSPCPAGTVLSFA